MALVLASQSTQTQPTSTQTRLLQETRLLLSLNGTTH